MLSRVAARRRADTVSVRRTYKRPRSPHRCSIRICRFHGKYRCQTAVGRLVVVLVVFLIVVLDVDGHGALGDTNHDGCAVLELGLPGCHPARECGRREDWVSERSDGETRKMQDMVGRRSKARNECEDVVRLGRMYSAGPQQRERGVARSNIARTRYDTFVPDQHEPLLTIKLLSSEARSGPCSLVFALGQKRSRSLCPLPLSLRAL